MIHQFFSAFPTAPLEVTLRESPQHQFPLIEPRSVRRSHKHPHPSPIPSQKIGRLLADVTGTAIPDQMDFSPFFELVEHLFHHRTEMHTVILVQTPPPHLAVMHQKGTGKVDRARPGVFKLLPFYLPRAHRLLGTASLRRLHVGLFIKADDQLPPLLQAVNLLVAPKDFAGSLCKLFVEGGGLPIAVAMRLQGGIAQKQRNCRMRHLGHDASLLRHFRQGSGRLVGHPGPHPDGLTTRQLLDLHPHQGGNLSRMPTPWGIEYGLCSPLFIATAQGPNPPRAHLHFRGQVLHDGLFVFHGQQHSCSTRCPLFRATISHKPLQLVPMLLSQPD